MRTIDWFKSYLSVLEIHDEDLHDLGQLQFQHLKKIPFQNIEGIRNGRRYFDFENPSTLLEPVLQGIGGICFHLNYSFQLLLKEIGFKCYLISCRLSESDFDHMALVVEEDGLLKLVDVGMGTYHLTKPMVIEDGSIHQDVSGLFRVRRDQERFIVERFWRRKWVFVYSFLLTPRRLEDFEYIVDRHYVYDSDLRGNVICSRWGDNGLFARLYNKKVTLYRGEDNFKIKLEGFEMENVLKWDWLTGILVMMGSSSNDEDSDKKKKTWPCWCPSNPDIRQKTEEGPYGTKRSIFYCTKCGWRDEQTLW